MTFVHNKIQVVEPNSKELVDARNSIKGRFFNSKKLPANTPQKYGKTFRIGFQRRQCMEHKPLIIIMFSELIGYFESELCFKDKENIQHKIYYRKGVTMMIDEILSRGQVALFIDVHSSSMAQQAKGNIV